MPQPDRAISAMKKTTIIMRTTARRGTSRGGATNDSCGSVFTVPTVWRDEKQPVKTTEHIVDIWYNSVGGNSVLLLNKTEEFEVLLAQYSAPQKSVH